MCIINDYRAVIDDQNKTVAVTTRYIPGDNSKHMRDIALEIIKEARQRISYTFIFHSNNSRTNNVPYTTDAEHLNITLKDIQE